MEIPFGFGDGNITTVTTQDMQLKFVEVVLNMEIIYNLLSKSCLIAPLRLGKIKESTVDPPMNMETNQWFVSGNEFIGFEITKQHLLRMNCLTYSICLYLFINLVSNG